MVGQPLAAETCGGAVQFEKVGGTWIESPQSFRAPSQRGALQGWSVAASGTASLVALPDLDSGGAAISGPAAWYDPAAGAYGDGFEAGVEACLVDLP